jgi:hypothetical protein
MHLDFTKLTTPLHKTTILWTHLLGDGRREFWVGTESESFLIGESVEPMSVGEAQVWLFKLESMRKAAKVLTRKGQRCRC